MSFYYIITLYIRLSTLYTCVNVCVCVKDGEKGQTYENCNACSFRENTQKTLTILNDIRSSKLIFYPTIILR